jgi:hypothetical protein
MPRKIRLFVQHRDGSFVLNPRLRRIHPDIRVWLARAEAPGLTKEQRARVAELVDDARDERADDLETVPLRDADSGHVVGVISRDGVRAIVARK